VQQGEACDAGDAPKAQDSTPATGIATPKLSSLDPGTLNLLEQRQAQQDDVHKNLASNIERAQHKQKSDFLRRHHLCTDPAKAMPEGTYVLLKAPATSKLHRCKSVEGPYRLTKYIDGSTRAVIEEAGGKKWPVATSRLAPYEEQ
jgi:hypothetical protein